MFQLTLVAGVGALLGYANPLFHFPLAILAFPLCLAWIGLHAVSSKKAFQFGWLAGFIASISSFYWVPLPVQIYGGIPWYLALLCPLLLAALTALYYALYATILYFVAQKISDLPLCLFTGVLWAAMESLIGTAFSGLPWMPLTSAFVSWPFLIQGVSIIGTYAFSGIIAIFATGLLFSFTQRKILFSQIVLSLLICSFGFYRMTTFAEDNAPFPIAIIQGNVDQNQKWNPVYQASTVKTYRELTFKALRSAEPQLVVWPETAMPFYFQDRTPYKTAVQNLAADTHTAIITGSPAYKVTDIKTRQFKLFNRAWLIDDTGRALQYYDKEHLVPFGEYMPLAEWLPFKQLVQSAGIFHPGTETHPLMLDGVALGMQICYEGIFPELAQKQVEQGATVLLNISNDAWFGATSAPLQHLNLTILRAVEQGRWLVRSTNNGISAFINPLGQITAKSKQFHAEAMTSDVHPRTEQTVFHEYYQFIQLFIYIFTMIGLGYTFLSPRGRKIG